MAVCIAQHVSLQGLFFYFGYDTCISAPAQQEDGGRAKRRREPDTSHHAGHPGQHCGRANTVDGRRERNVSRRLSTCLGMMFQHKETEWRRKLLTLFFFWMPRGKQKQQEAQRVFCESRRETFFFLIVANLILLLISFNFLPINERVSYFVNTSSVLSALYWWCLWRKHAFLIAF